MLSNTFLEGSTSLQANHLFYLAHNLYCSAKALKTCDLYHT